MPWWLAALLSAACYSLQYLLLEVLFTEKEKFAPYYTFLTLANAVALAAIMFGLYPDQDWSQLRQSWSVAGLMLLYVLAGSGAYLFNALAILDKNATHASLLEITYPLFLIAFTAVFLHKVHLNFLGFVGTLLILGGTALVLYSQGNETAPEAARSQRLPDGQQPQQP
jgi:drug/metabolite transporter (DMT)-like permease